MFFFSFCTLKIFRKKIKITGCNGENGKITIKEETIPRVVSMREDCGLRLEQHRNGKEGGWISKIFRVRINRICWLTRC